MPSTIYELRSFQDLYTTVMNDLQLQLTDTTSLNRIKRDINIIYQNKVASYRNWKWLNGEIDVTIDTPITAGSTNCTNGNTTITFTSAPVLSQKGKLFSLNGLAEVYKIAHHTAGASTAILSTPYIGATTTLAPYKLWSDKITLPVDCRETRQIFIDGSTQPLEPKGKSELKRYIATNPKAEGIPQFCSTGEYSLSEQAEFSVVSGLPAINTSASSGTLKTLVFNSSLTSYLQVGDRIEVTNSNHYSFNGEFVISSVSTNTLTYIGTVKYQQSATSDSSLTLKTKSTENSTGRFREVTIYPSIYTSNTLLAHVEYSKEVKPLVEDSDEPLMPISDRSVLLFGAEMRAWARQRNAQAQADASSLFMDKLNEMAAKLEDSHDNPLLMPDKTWLASKRLNSRRDINNSDW